MNVAQFKAIVAAEGGEAKVIAIIFDNASRKVFTEGDYSHTKYLKETNEYFVFPEQDARRNKYNSIKFAENIQGIIMSNDETVWGELDQRLMGS